MASQWLKARQTKYVAYLVTYVLVVIAVIAVANVLADRYNKSYDSTSNKRYSLSDQTAKIVKGLKQDATITYFNPSIRFDQGKDLLDEYANLSPKVHVKYIDPEKNPADAQSVGVKTFVNTAVVAVGNRKEEAASMTEEGVTGAFIRDLKASTRTVCFVEGSGEHQIDDSGREGFSKFKDELAKDNYQTKAIDLIGKAEVPSECTTMVIGGPTRNYVQPQVDAIKNYVDNGGRVFFMVNPPLNMGGHLQSADNQPVTDLLEGWGVTPEKDLVLDMNPIGQIMGLGVQVALVNHYSAQPIVSELKGTATGFPFSRSLDIKSTDKTTVEKLFDSSGSSLATVNLSSPSVDIRDPKNKRGPLTLAAAGTYNTGKENSQGRFVVVGSSGWVTNGYIDFDANGDLALNAVNWLSSDEDLISIRPKPPEDRRITMTKSQFNFVLATSQFVLPLIVVVAGVAVWWKRR